MHWLEIITLRAAGNADKNRALEIWQEMESQFAAAGTLEASLYRAAKLENDLSVHLYWHSWGAQGNCGEKSSQGLQLAEAFKSCGLVNHDIWTDAQVKLT